MEGSKPFKNTKWKNTARAIGAVQKVSKIQVRILFNEEIVIHNLQNRIVKKPKSDLEIKKSFINNL